jgi:tetratricopeptide (TPR) repeat protein
MSIPVVLICTALLSMQLAGAAHAGTGADGPGAGDPIAALQQQLQRHPDDFQAWFRLGVTQAKARRFHDAIASFGKVIELQPKLAEPHNNLAVIYNELGDYRAAVRELEASLQLKPDYATAHENIGDLYVKLAADAYRKALATDVSPALRRRYERLLHIRDEASAPQQHGAEQGAQPHAAAVASASLEPESEQTPPDQKRVQQAERKMELVAVAQPAAITPWPIEPTSGLAAAGNGTHADMAKLATAVVDQARDAPAADEPVNREQASDGQASDEQPNAERQGDASAAVAASERAAALLGADDVQAALAAVEAWRSAWNRQDLPAYFAAYSPDFDFGSRFDTLAQWRKYKQWVIRKRAFIQVSLENIEAKPLSGGVIRLVFLQHFRSDSYNSDDIKELLLRRSPDGWKIIHEVSR